MSSLFRQSGSEESALYPVEAAANNREQSRADAIARIGATDATAPAAFHPADWESASFETAWRAWLNETFEGANGLAVAADGERLAPEEFSSRHQRGPEAARRVFRLDWAADSESAVATGRIVRI